MYVNCNRIKTLLLSLAIYCTSKTQRHNAELTTALTIPISHQLVSLSCVVQTCLEQTPYQLEPGVKILRSQLCVLFIHKGTSH